MLYGSLTGNVTDQSKAAVPGATVTTLNTETGVLLQHGTLSAIAGGWQLNVTLSRTSGTPFTVTASGTSLNASGNTQVADQVLPTVAIPGGHGSTGPYFNPAAFAPVTGVRFGNSGRNELRGPGVFDLDLDLFRLFVMRERLNLQFRVVCTSAMKPMNCSVSYCGHSHGRCRWHSLWNGINAEVM